MPRQKRKSKLRTKTPSRVKKKRPAKQRPRSLHRPELWGLGLVALGLFLGSIIYAGWNGGYVGRALADGLDALIGGASWAIPVGFVVLGSLMVARSALVDVPRRGRRCSDRRHRLDHSRRAAARRRSPPPLRRLTGSDPPQVAPPGSRSSSARAAAAPGRARDVG
jgi:hypothetical protein